mgnify:CR=1 FL=1
MILYIILLQTPTLWKNGMYFFFKYFLTALIFSALPYSPIISMDRVEDNESKIQKTLEKIVGLVVGIAASPNENPYVTSYSTGFIINNMDERRINILTAAHTFEKISSTKEKMLENVRFVWFFIPHSSVGWEISSLGIDNFIDEIGIIPLKPASLFNECLRNIYTKDTNEEESINFLKPGEILFEEEKVSIIKKLPSISSNWMLITKLMFPSFSRKNIGDSLWQNNEELSKFIKQYYSKGAEQENKAIANSDDIVLAEAVNIWEKSSGSGSDDEFNISSDPLQEFNNINEKIDILSFACEKDFGEYVFSILHHNKSFSFGFSFFTGQHPNDKAKFVSGDINELLLGYGNGFSLILSGAGPGSSGSPIVILHEGTMKIIGIISGDGGNGKTKASFIQSAPGLENLIPRSVGK